MLEFSVKNLKYASSFSLSEIREPLNTASSSLEALACCVYDFGVEELRDVVQNEQLHEAAVSAVPASVVKAAPLSVSELQKLHKVLWNSMSWDSTFAATVLYCVYACARREDSMHLWNLLFD